MCVAQSFLGPYRREAGFALLPSALRLTECVHLRSGIYTLTIVGQEL